MPPKSEPSNKDPARFNEAQEFAKPAVKATKKPLVKPRKPEKPRRGHNQSSKRERIIGPCEDVTLPCEDGQRYIDPSDCRSYYVCASRHRLVRLTCPLGTAWHHRARVCVDDRNVYSGLCDADNPANRCPRDHAAARMRPPILRRPPPPPNISPPVTPVSSGKTLNNVTTTTESSGRRITLSIPGEKSGIHSESKATTLKPKEMEAPPGGQLERSDAEVIVIAVVGGLIFAALIAIILVLVWRKRRDEKSSESSPSPRTTEQKTSQRCIHNPEYSRRNSAIYAEIDDTLRGPLMTSTISKDCGKTMSAQLQRHLPPRGTLQVPMRTDRTGTLMTSQGPGTVSSGVLYPDSVADSDRDTDITFYEKLSTTSDTNFQPTELGYDLVGNCNGHVYSTLSTRAKDGRYELLNEMSSASPNPSECTGNSASSSPAFVACEQPPEPPSQYFVLDTGEQTSGSLNVEKF